MAVVFDFTCPRCEKEHSFLNPNFEQYLCGCGNRFYWKVTIKARRKQKPNKSGSQSVSKKYTKSLKNKQKIYARRKVFIEVRAGRLIKEPCGVCENEETQAHHPDYSRPLYVFWLCKAHHVIADRLVRNADILSTGC